MVCLGFEPGAARMVGADETTELWRPPSFGNIWATFFSPTSGHTGLTLAYVEVLPFRNFKGQKCLNLAHVPTYLLM